MKTVRNFKHPNTKYNFIRKLGDGSASKIYISENKETKEKVVIKCINKREEWKSEYGILKSIMKSSSPKLLKLLDIFETYRYVYIVTEYYKGKDLFDHVDINTPYPENFAKLLVKEMGECVKECHNKDIAHLDIKCENFMVKGMTPTPKLVLIDFGHAEKVKHEDLAEGYSRYGTSFYLCPEGYSRIYSKKSDIWSLGVCSHLILSGSYPFDRDSTEYFKSGETRMSSKLSDEAKDFVSKCMQINPEDRYSIDGLLNSPFLV